MMAEDEKQTSPRYEALKQRLWNQPRPRQFLERLEKHGARPALLERVAQLFVAGRHGEAEVLAAIYYDLLRHRDRADLLRRIADLRTVSSQTEQDLLSLANGLEKVGDRETCTRRLGLSNKMMSALVAVRKSPPAGLDLLLRGVAEKYSKESENLPPQTEVQGEEWAVVMKLKRIADLRLALSRLHQNLLRLLCELDQFKGWEAYRTVGYEDFHGFVSKELGLSDKIAETLILVREEAGLPPPGALLQAIIKGYTASVEPVRKGEVDARKAL